MGVLPGHANLLLQGAHKPSDAQPAPKQPKSTHAPAPKPVPKPASFSWEGVFCTLVVTVLWLGPKLVVKIHGNGKYNIQFQQDGTLRRSPFCAYDQIAKCIGEVFCVQGISLLQPFTVLYCFLLYAHAQLPVPLFQQLMSLVHYYRDEFTNRF